MPPPIDMRKELSDDSESEDEESEDEESSDASGSEEDFGAGSEEDAGLEEREDGQGPSAEMQIEGDFDRLIQNIRNADASTNTGMLSREWDFNAEEQDAIFRDDLRAASGIGKKGKKRGGRRGPVLSPQVKAMLGEGNQAFIDDDIPKAVQIMQEVIRIEPRARAAWVVLANIHERDNPEKALQLRIMAAHLQHEADDWLTLARESRERGFNKQALYCYGKVASLDPSNINALWDRASLAKELGEYRIVRFSLLGILKSVPHDLTILEEIRPILVELSDLNTCASLYHGAFTHFQSLYPSGLGPGPDPTVGDIPGGGFGHLQLLVLADLYNGLNEHDKAVHVIRNGSRWLQGRADQKFWDACEDDREYDIGDWRTEGGSGANGREGWVQPGKYPLDVNARHRLAVARLRMGEMDEGVMHAKVILAQDVFDYAPLFAEIADAYYDSKMYADAKPIYETLAHDAATSSLHILLQVARCCHLLGDLREAADVYEHVLAADATDNESKMRLAEIYEVLNEPRKALELVFQVIESRRRPRKGATQTSESTDAPTTSLFEESSKRYKQSAKAKFSHAELKEMETQKEEEVLRSYQRVQATWDDMLKPDGTEGQAEAEREWLVEVERMTESFRMTKKLFLTSRSDPFRGMFPSKTSRKTRVEDEDALASRIALEMEDERAQRALNKANKKPEKVTIFRGIHFDEWLRVFMQYAFVLTKRGQYDLAEELLSHILHSNAYQSPEVQDTIRIAIMTCAANAKNYDTVVEQGRKIINSHQFNNEPMRVLVASLASGFRNTDAFITSKLQKHLLREIKLSDAAIRHQDALKWYAPRGRWALAPSGSWKGEEAGGDDDVDDAGPSTNLKTGGPPSDLPKVDNPMLVTIYGQLSLGARSYQSAIYYLLHAYDYCPQEPMVCLSLAIASMGRAMQRQADNRHHLVAQAMAFLTKYHELRQSDSVGQDEIDYNFGRSFHQLGLHSLAVKHYERVLALAEERTKSNPEDIGLAKEAAYNLSLIFVITGAAPLAEALYRRWLSF